MISKQTTNAHKSKEVHPRTGHGGPEREQMYSSTLPSTSALDGQRQAPTALTPQERPGTNYIGSWVGPRDGLDGCRNPRPPLGFDPRTVQQAASRYTG